MLYNEIKMPAFESDQIPLFSVALYSQAVSLYARPEKKGDVVALPREELEAGIGEVAVSPEDLLSS